MQSFAGGAGLLLCYSLLLVIRRIIPHSPVAVGISDLFYWLAVALLVFVRIYRINQGTLRNFLLLGMASGAVLTYLTIRPGFEKICYMILEIPVRLVKKIFKKYVNRLLFLGKRCKIFVRQSAKQYKNSTGNYQQMRRGRQFGKIREKTKKKDNRV